MPEITIPLVGSPDSRNDDAFNNKGKGQRFVSTVFDVIKNPVTGSGRVYVNKRPGFAKTDITTGGGVALSDDNLVSIFSTTTGEVWYNAVTNCGYVGTQVYGGIPLAYIGGEKIWLISTYDSGWYLATGALSGGVTFTADRTSGSAVLANVSSFTGLYVGQLLSGTGIPATARIASMDTGASTVTMTANATSGAPTSTTVTRERIAQIIDADFPANIVGLMVEIDGYVFVGKYSSQQIFNSDQNSVTSWNAAGYLSLNSSSGEVSGVAKYKGRLVGFGSTGFEFFYNAGNTAPASPFTRTGDSSGVGCWRSLEQSSVWNGRRTIAWGDDYVAFFGLQGGVYLLDGGNPKKITDSTVTRLLPNDNAYGRLSIINMMGRRVLISDSLAYDLELGVWYEHGIDTLARFGGTDGVLELAGNVYEDNDRVQYVANGDLLKTNPNSPLYEDNAVTYTMTIQTAGLDLGSGNRKTVEFYEIDSDVQSSGTATLEVSDDDGANWTTVGTFDQTKVNPRIYRGGSWKGKRMHRITHSANTAFRASQLRIKFTVGAH